MRITILFILSLFGMSLIQFALPQQYAITTVAGGGSDIIGDNIPATQVFLNKPYGLEIHGELLYIADTYNDRIRVMNLTSHKIRTIAGSGVRGFNGDFSMDAMQVMFRQPEDVKIDPTDGNLIISDTFNNRIRKMWKESGNVSTIAGTGATNTAPGLNFNSDNILAVDSLLAWPLGILPLSNGELIISDMWNHRIRKILTNGTITTIYGNGLEGSAADGSIALNSRVCGPGSVIRLVDGSLGIAEIYTNKIRSISLENGTLTTLGGIGPVGMVIKNGGLSGDGGLAINAKLNNPHFMATSPSGDLFISDSYNGRIRKIQANGTISTIAGMGAINVNWGTLNFNGDFKIATQALLSFPTGIVYDKKNDEIYFADSSNNRIRKLSLSIFCNGTLYTNSSVCSGNGKCIATETCQCNSGWKGQLCETPDCGLVHNCSSYGNCIGPNQCQCETGYLGIDCSIPTCENISSLNSSFVCSGNGKCQTLNSCNCSEGYFGIVCQLTTCNGFLSNSSQVCLGRGKCVGPEKCSCFGSWVGSNCEIFDSSPKLKEYDETGLIVSMTISGVILLIAFILDIASCVNIPKLRMKFKKQELN
ncbi:predicted protein [Naegleria gruberi]|uniref:Predicted protein n=1 Tax=Naegleria gruberi TaxID=5762 RepID=D2VMP6_NAEGR|nr:uncharacterized protein NAEGRDRAFT_80566 [Naegleria gruberi]EFC41868.1 predicted protein [Naegleria gruberi]|eukprot:XP_002674612.1 predicted protein [Naegleria gruberi strain NEG-M]